MDRKVPENICFAKVIFFILIAMCASSCSVKKMAINSIAESMSGDASDVFMGDNDPVLVGDSLPVILKMMDVMAAASPSNPNILSNAGSLFVMYANVYLQLEADMLPYEEWELQKEMYGRAKKLYRRGYEYIVSSLELRYKGFKEKIAAGDYEAAFEKMKKKDAADLYWGGAAILAGVSVDILDPFFASDRDTGIKMLFKAEELDPDFGNGMLDEVMMIYYASMPDGMGGDMKKAIKHFHRGIELSEGNMISLYVSYALSISTKKQNREGYEEFKEMLCKALEKDAENSPENRLANIINRKKAGWLLKNADNYFLIDF